MNQLRLAYPSVHEASLQNALDETRGDVPLALRLVRLRCQVGPSWPPQTGLDDGNSRKRHNNGDQDTPVDSLSKRRRVSLSLIQTPHDKNLQELHPSNANISTVASDEELTSMVECACCFGDISLSLATFCTNPDPHYFCFQCAAKNAETEIEKSRFNLVCFDLSGCKFTFSESEIRRSLDRKTFERFDQLRTDQELRQADLEGLVICPFCPFAAILDDPTDTIFECLRCSVRSCRHCRVKDHRPLTCDQYQREKNIPARAIVEEAMTDALLRKCNGCGVRFLKEDGCNKMTCPRCNNKQCFVCSENVGNYEHFRAPKNGFKGCPMYGDMAELLQKEVAIAQENTVRRLVRNRPDLKEDDLIVDKNATLGQAGQPTKNPEGVMHPGIPGQAQGNIDMVDFDVAEDPFADEPLLFWNWRDDPPLRRQSWPDIIPDPLFIPPPTLLGREWTRHAGQEHRLDPPNPPPAQPQPFIVNRPPPVYHLANPPIPLPQMYTPQPQPPQPQGNFHPQGRANGQVFPPQPPPGPLQFPIPYVPYHIPPHIQPAQPQNPNPPPPNIYQAPAPQFPQQYWHPPQAQQQQQYPPYEPPRPYLYPPPPTQPQPCPFPQPHHPFPRFPPQPPPQPPMHYPQYNAPQYLPATGTAATQTEPRREQTQMQNPPEPQIGQRRRQPWETFHLHNGPFGKRPRLQ